MISPSRRTLTRASLSRASGGPIFSKGFRHELLFDPVLFAAAAVGTDQTLPVSLRFDVGVKVDSPIPLLDGKSLFGGVKEEKHWALAVWDASARSPVSLVKATTFVENALSPDGRSILVRATTSPGEDRTNVEAFVWDAVAGSRTSLLKGSITAADADSENDRVSTCGEFCSDGSLLALGGGTSKVRVWKRDARAKWSLFSWTLGNGVTGRRRGCSNWRGRPAARIISLYPIRPVTQRAADLCWASEGQKGSGVFVGKIGSYKTPDPFVPTRLGRARLTRPRSSGRLR